MQNEKLNKLNCMNYQMCYADGEYCYLQCGLRSLFELSKQSNEDFKIICSSLYKIGQVTIQYKKELVTIIMI